MADLFNIDVVYAKPERQELVHLKLAPGSTLKQAVEASGLLQRCPELDPEKLKLGVYGKISKPDMPLRDRDRVEIYRPLIADPKEVRKKRAEEGKVMKKGGGGGED
jgi:hypothetical protein